VVNLNRLGKFFETYLVLSGNLFPFENVDDILNPETQVKYEAKTLFFSGANSKRILIQQSKALPCPVVLHNTPSRIKMA
jgi:hypothetical protein